MSYLSKIFNVIAGSGLLGFGYSYYRNTRELERLHKANSEKNRMTSELRLASQIQLSMMPVGHRILDNVEVYGTLLPAREMGGDLFEDPLFINSVLVMLLSSRMMFLVVSTHVLDESVN